MGELTTIRGDSLRFESVSYPDKDRDALLDETGGRATSCFNSGFDGLSVNDHAFESDSAHRPDSIKESVNVGVCGVAGS